ncbi:MAG: glycosyltransferase [Pseudomonadota bacterium]
MLRVLTLSTLYPNSVNPGLGSFVARQTERLAARNDVDLEVVAPIPKFRVDSRGMPFRALADVPARTTRGGVTVHHPRFESVPMIGWRKNGAAIARAVLDMVRPLHQATPFDVIDCEFFFPDAVAALDISRALGLPYSVKARGSDITMWGRRYRARRQMIGAGRHANGMLAVSKALKRDMVKMGLPAERIRVHYTGIDLDRFVPPATRPAGRPRLVAMGNLIALKRHDLLIKAMPHLPEHDLDIIGDGPERGRLERLIAQLRLGDRVSLAGRLPHDQIPARLGAATALLHASASEGLANVWLEAMACGTPVITTNVGGAKEVIPTGLGMLLPADSAPVRFATAVRELAAKAPDRHAVRVAAQPFSWDANTSSLYDHLSGLI